MKCLMVGAISPPLGGVISQGCYPFGALAVATYLNKHGIETKVVSTSFNTPKEICDLIVDCDMVGISSMTGPYLKYAITVAKATRRINPCAKIIWGGSHASLMDEEVLREGLADYVIRGVGEKGMLSLVQGCELNSTPGLSYLQDGELVRNNKDECFDINSLHEIDYALLSNNSTLKDIYPYFSSRGCPFNCSFCVSSELYNRKWYNKNEDKIVNELKLAWEKYKFNYVSFWDDNFFVDFKRVNRIISRLLESGVKINWGGYCRVDAFCRHPDEEIINLRNKGLDWLSFGAESGSDITLNRLSKGTTVNNIKETALKLRRVGINGDFSFMGGLPGENIEEFGKTISLLRWIKENNSRISIRLFKFVPYPCMPIIKDIDIDLPKNIYEWSNVTYQAASFKWVPDKINNTLDVFSAASMYSDKPKRFSIFTILYYLTQFRFRFNFFMFPIESRLINMVYTWINLNKHKQFERKIYGNMLDYSC